MKSDKLYIHLKRDRTVVVADFFGAGQNLEAHKLGWQLEDRLEAQSLASKNIFNYYIDDMCANLIFYYVEDGCWYGIHNEVRPMPFFRFKPKEGILYPSRQLPCDTHLFRENEILQWIECGECAWDEIKLQGKSIEEVLQKSYILVS